MLANNGGQLVELIGLALELALLRNEGSRESRGGESEEREEESGLHFDGGLVIKVLSERNFEREAFLCEREGL